MAHDHTVSSERVEVLEEGNDSIVVEISTCSCGTDIAWNEIARSPKKE